MKKTLLSILAITLTTYCSIGQTVLNENFSSGLLPLGWTESSNATGVVWEYGNTVDFGPSTSVIQDANGTLGEYASMDISDDPDTTSLITPAVSILGVVNPRLTFQYNSQSNATNFSPWNRLIVDYWNGASWTNITVIDTLTPAGWTFYEFNISTFTYKTDSVQFRFSAQEGGAAIGGNGNGTYNQDMALDNVVIEKTPTCLKPSSPFTNVVPTGVELNWTENNTATVWEIEHGTLGFTLGTGTRDTVSINPTILTSLISGNTYDWYIRSVCTVGDSSSWQKGNSFRYAGPPLAGIYTINPAIPTGGRNFQNFDDLEFKLDFAGISAAVTVNVTAGTYNEQFSLGKIAGSSPTNTIVIDGGSASTTTISHDRSIRNSTVTIAGTGYITFKNMTVVATSSSNDTWGINILDSAHHVLIDSNVITMQTGSLSDVAGINMCTETSDQSSGYFGFNVTISNNFVTGGERGITTYGNNNWPIRGTNISIINNNVQNADDFGIWAFGIDTVNISNNYSVNATNNTTNDGMYISDCENFIISGNYAKGSDNGFEGLDLNFGIPTTSRSSIVNNMFIGGDDGMFLEDIEEIDIFHNSSSAEDRGIDIDDDVNLDIRNNIFASNSDYAFYCTDLSTTMTLDYNLYYTAGTNLAYYNAAYVDLAAFRTGQATLNVKSIEGYPSFNSPTSDLHVSGPLANDIGDPTVGLLVDYDGDTRPMTPSLSVDIGADEYTPALCMVPGNLTTSNITSSSALLTFIETGSSTDWEVEYGPTGFLPGSGTTVLLIDTFTTITGLAFETNYDWSVRSICNRGDTSARSTLSFYTGYCNPAPLSVHGSGITNVSYDTVNYTTGTELNNYGNHSANIGNLRNNTVNSVNITFNTGFTYDTKIWVDWNKDLDFNDPGEEVYIGVSMSANPTTLVTSFFIPSTIPLDQYRMRIGAIESGTPTPCYTGIWGTYEDYTINVIQGASCSAPISIGTLNLSNDSATVSWDKTGTETQWEVEYGTANFAIGTGNSAIVNVDTFTTFQSLLPSTDYEWYVRAICGSNDTSAWTGPISFTTLQNPPPYYPIGTINTVNALGVADSIGTKCFTSGIVMGTDLNANGGYIFTIIDMSSGSQEGIGVFNNSIVNGYVVTQGDSILVEGNVSQFRGLTQLNNINSITILATGVTEPTPIIVNQASEGTESKWIQINNLTAIDPTGSGSYDQRFVRAGDTTLVRVDSDTDVNDSLAFYPINIGDSLCSIVGIGGQFTYSTPALDGYQLIPSRYADLDTAGCTFIVGIESKVDVKSTFKLYPNPTNGQFVLETTGFDNSTVNIIVRDINGRVINTKSINNANSAFTKSFDLSGNAKGVYFITIQDGENLINQKLIIQ